MSLRKKLLLSIYAILIVVLLFSSVLAIWLQYQADKNRNIQLYQRFAQTACQDIDYLLQDVLDISVYFVVNDEIEAVLNTSEEQQFESPLFWMTETPLEFLKDILAIKSHIKNVILYPENGKTPFYVSRDASVFDTEIAHLRESEIYEKTLEARGDVVWERVSRGENAPFLRNMSDKIVAHRELFDMSKKKRLGHVIVTITAASFEQVCERMLQLSGETAVVLNAEGEEFVVLGETRDVLASVIDQSGIRNMNAEAMPQMMLVNGYYLFLSKSRTTGITVCLASPVRLWRHLIQFGNLLVPELLLLALATLFFPLSAMISRQLTRPIEELAHSMERFKEGDFSQQVPVESEDEIGRLSETFNKMVVDLRDLIDRNYVMTLREREMELNTLQSQINPHFLYNVLDSLYWQAIDKGNETLAEDILTLSRLFRMVLSQGQFEISVRWEVELITCYLQIQKMRFSRRLSYDIQVDEEIMDCRISKLMIQPFVENAVVHGLEMQEEGGRVTLNGHREGEFIVFTISDNGIGMEQETADRLLVEDYKESIGRYAIRNVKERLTLKYGNRYDLKIDSSPGKGTVVTMKIPFERRENRHEPEKVSPAIGG